MSNEFASIEAFVKLCDFLFLVFVFILLGFYSILSVYIELDFIYSWGLLNFWGLISLSLLLPLIQCLHSASNQAAFYTLCPARMFLWFVVLHS